MMVISDVEKAIDNENTSIGKVHPIALTRLMELLNVKRDTPEFTLLGSMLDVLIQIKTLKKINGIPPLFLRI